MKRIASVLSALFLLLTATVAFSGPYSSNQPEAIAPDSSSSGNCQTKLGNNAYDCNFASSFGSPFTDCFQFESPGMVSSHFDLLVSGLMGTLGCSCDPTGSLTNPQFNGSPNAFDCVGTDGSGFYDFAGKVTPKKISGHVAADSGDSFLYSCTKRSSPCL